MEGAWEMDQEEQKDKHSLHKEYDPFTSFMFGGKRIVKEEQTKNQQEFPIVDEWLFGKQNKNSHKNTEEERNESTPLGRILTNINMEELVKNMDTIMNSASQFKPLLKKVTPLINKWIK